MICFILGGAKSGKSQYAEQLVMQHAAPWIYLATGRAWDEEMRHKISLHQKRRGKGWVTLEEAIDISAVINQLDQQPVLIDCLTLWLTNLMMEEKDIPQETERLVKALAAYQGRVVLVSNEVGQGIVPENPLARRFVNEAGILHQRIAAIAEEFTVMQAGYPLKLRDRNSE